MNSAFVSDKPDLTGLQELFCRCAPESGGWNRIHDSDQVRYCRWDGQSPDGRKHQDALGDGRRVFPFENASDVRWPTADMLVREHAAFLTEAFHRAMTRVQGNPETERTGRAASARKLLEWVRRGKLYVELNREVTLLAQHGCSYGPALVQVGWERTLAYRPYTVTLEALMAAAQERADSGVVDALVVFPQMLMDPAQDSQSVEVLRRIYEHYVQASWPEDYGLEIAPLKDGRARRAIRSLREDGKADLPLPYLCKNQPTWRARKLWEDAYVPDGTGDIQEASVVFLLDYYSAAELRAKAAAEGWSEEWVEAAVKHAGEYALWTTRRTSASAQEAGTLGYEARDEDCIEVTTALRKQVDEDGVMQVVETIYHQNVARGRGNAEELVARHGPMEFPLGDQYPLVDWRFETAQRALGSARGIPQMVATQQRTLKVHIDMLVDRASMETVPTRLVDARWGMGKLYGPAVDAPLKQGEMKPEYLALPGTSRSAEGLMVEISKEIDRYFARPGEGVPPELALITRQQLVRSFLVSCSAALALTFKLMADQMPKDDIARITGLPDGVLGEPEELADDTLYLLSYDVQEMSPEYREARNRRLLELAAADPTGTLDRSKLIGYIVRSEDPDVAAEIVTGQEGRNAQVFKSVKQDLDDIFKGIPPQLVENDPTAGAKLEYANQLVGVSPLYQQAFRQSPESQQLLKAYMEGLQFAHEQMTTNKQIGRVGVDMNRVVAEREAA